MRVYIESTIPSYLAARPARDLLQAGRQQTTTDWWNQRRHLHQLFASQLVWDEILAGDPAMAAKRVSYLKDIPSLEITPESLAIYRLIADARILPPNAAQDASHIALASAHSVDILLTWNLRHIANAFIKRRLIPLFKSAGFTLPEIATPDTLMFDELGRG